MQMHTSCFVLFWASCCFPVEIHSINSLKNITFLKDRKQLPPGRIVGGQEVTPHAYPFQVGLLIYLPNDIYFCGGTLISTEWVLTAAHCFAEEIEDIEIFLGSHNLTVENESSRIVLRSTQYIQHSGWDSSTLHNDIGLLRLPINVTLNENITTVEIAKGGNTFTGRIGTMLGWGLTSTSHNATRLSQVLKEAAGTIISNKECGEYFGPEFMFPSQLCVFGFETGRTCNGDSGGPLIVDGVQVGITSFGSIYCDNQIPYGFTRISEYHDWLQQYVSSIGKIYNSLYYSTVIPIVICLYRFFI